MTENQLLEQALNAQDACNLTGVVHSFSRAMSRLRELHPDKGTDFFNTHSVAVLYASKIASLTCSESLLGRAITDATTAILILEEKSSTATG